jgi:hypothetical protein
MRKIIDYDPQDVPIYETSFWHDKLKPFLRYLAFWLLSLTWGLPLTLGGIVFFLISFLTRNIKDVKIVVGRVVVTLKSNIGGVSLGGFNFIGKWATIEVKWHEIGHSVQNYIMGPFILPFALWSLIRAALWTKIVNKNPKADYDKDYWLEWHANRMGFKVASGKVL